MGPALSTDWVTGVHVRVPTSKDDFFEGLSLLLKRQV